MTICACEKAGIEEIRNASRSQRAKRNGRMRSPSWFFRAAPPGESIQPERCETFGATRSRLVRTSYEGLVKTALRVFSAVWSTSQAILPSTTRECSSLLSSPRTVLGPSHEGIVVEFLKTTGSSAAPSRLFLKAPDRISSSISQFSRMSIMAQLFLQRFGRIGVKRSHHSPLSDGSHVK